MTTKSSKRFKGKIHGEPWEALAKGPREVLGTIWEDYLSEVLAVAKDSPRYKILRREIETAAGYQEALANWNDLPPESRAVIWRRLMTVSRNLLTTRGQDCVRCGTCCEQGSPTLMAIDLGLFGKNVLTMEDVYTLRAGEQAASREGTPVTLGEERLKIREIPGSRQCWFYLPATMSCRIYEERPEQCRRQTCWSEPPEAPEAAELLSRRHLLSAVPEMWQLVEEHQKRCDLSRVAQILAEVAEGQEEAGDALFEALHFDHYLRRLLIDDWGVTPAATELLLGRPLTEFLRTRGIEARLTPEGVFHLSPRQEAEAASRRE